MLPSAAFPPLVVTVKETQRLTSLSHGQVYAALNSGLLESRKVLGRRLVIYESIQRLLLTNADARPPTAFREHPRGDGTLRDGRGRAPRKLVAKQEEC
jgi:hypothetical protein